jgi:hypothetical protein
MMPSKRLLRIEEPSVPVVQGEVTRWAAQLTEVVERFSPRFPRAESRQRALAYVQAC